MYFFLSLSLFFFLQCSLCYNHFSQEVIIWFSLLWGKHIYFSHQVGYFSVVVGWNGSIASLQFSSLFLKFYSCSLFFTPTYLFLHYLSFRSSARHDLAYFSLTDNRGCSSFAVSFQCFSRIRSRRFSLVCFFMVTLRRKPTRE